VDDAGVRALAQEFDFFESYDEAVDQCLSALHKLDSLGIYPVRVLNDTFGVSLGSFSNVSPYAGCTFGIGRLAKIDVGYAAHIYRNLNEYNLSAEAINLSAKVYQIFDMFRDVIRTIKSSADGSAGTLGEGGPGGPVAAEEPPDSESTSADGSATHMRKQSISIRRNSHEVYCGIQLDMLCGPSVYMFYDITNEECALIASGAHSWNLSPRLNFEAKASAAYDYRRIPVVERGFLIFSTSGEEEVSRFRSNENYFYYSAEGVIAYRYNDNVTLKGRLSYCGNTAHKGDFTDVIFGGHHKNCVWLGGAVEMSF
jgi:hypothetical protein